MEVRERMDPPKLDVRKIVEEDLLSSRSKKERTHKVFYASELGYCPLKIYFSIVLPRPTEVRWLKTFHVGDLIHEYVQKLLEVRGAQSEVPIRQEIDPVRHIELHGRIDVLYDGEPYELKSTARLPDEPYPAHVDQLNAYLNLLGVRKGYLVYFEKNTMDIAQFEVRADKERWHAAISKVQMIHDAVESSGGNVAVGANELAQVVLPSWQCRYCAYRDVCPVARKPYK